MRVVICIVILFVTFLCNAQQRFNRTYVAPWINLSNSIELHGLDYFVLGQRLDTVNKKITLAQLNQNGDTTRTGFYGENDRAFFAQKLIKRQNDLLVFGGVNFDDFGINSDFFLASFDFDFSVNWIKYYGENYFDNGTDFLQNDDGTLLLCGTKSPTSANLENFYLVKTDENGNVLWERTYGGNNVDKAWSLIKSHDNGYLISGVSNSFSSSYDVLVYALDENGVELWHQTYGTSAVPVYAGHSIALPDKSYLLYKNIENPFPNYVAELMKIDKNGELIWTKNYAETTLSSFDFVKPLSLQDGTIIVSGLVYNSSNTPVGRILKLDPMGNIIWNRKYETNPNIDQYIYDIKQTPDDGFIFCGSAFDTLNKQRNWVVKLDCFGCDGELCDFGTSCEVYDCTGKDFLANFTVSTDTVFTNNNQPVIFTNTATETSNREWIFPNTTIYTSGTVNYQFNQVGTYNIQLITYHGSCSDTSTQTIVVTWPLGNEGLEMNDLFKLYPNPSSGTFYIENFSGKTYHFELLNTIGQVIYKSYSSEKKQSVDLNVEKGVYFVKINLKNMEVIRKIVIE